MKNDCIIRLETSKDHTEVEHMVRESFWNVYRPGCLEHYVLHCLRDDPAFIPELDFVMEKDGVIIGQNIFMRSSIAADDGRNIPILTMGPICITNALKRQEYGKILLDYSLEQAVKLGAGAVCFEGNIDFYGKSGFTYASHYGIRYHGLPEGEDARLSSCARSLFRATWTALPASMHRPPDISWTRETRRNLTNTVLRKRN